MSQTEEKIRQAYLLGFRASGQGWNGEYPFSQKKWNEVEDADWIESREESLAELFGDNDNTSTGLADLQRRCHDASYAAGWWHHPDTGLPYIPGDSARADNLAGGIVTIAWENIPVDMRDMITHYWPFVLATKMALIHSEVSEGLEALRRGARDDKLAHRLGLETELSDAVIREFDIAGVVARAQRLGIVEQHEGVGPFDLDGAITEKMAFNKSRPDHKVAARRAAGGKAF